MYDNHAWEIGIYQADQPQTSVNITHIRVQYNYKYFVNFS